MRLRADQRSQNSAQSIISRRKNVRDSIGQEYSVYAKPAPNKGELPEAQKISASKIVTTQQPLINYVSSEFVGASNNAQFVPEENRKGHLILGKNSNRRYLLIQNRSENVSVFLKFGRGVTDGTDNAMNLPANTTLTLDSSVPTNEIAVYFVSDTSIFPTGSIQIVEGTQG